GATYQICFIRTQVPTRFCYQKLLSIYGPGGRFVTISKSYCS
ncbi:MAG: hypothetical protein AVDCRST_MAG96-3920, partial [uncultured Segetibacter sp.]